MKLKRVFVVSLICILLILLLFIVTSKGFTTITELVHNDTKDVSAISGIDFSDSKLAKYQIEGVVFIPYIIRTYDNDNYDKYNLKLEVDKGKQNNCIVTVNYIEVEGAQDVNFKDSHFDINKTLEFQSDDNVLTSDNDMISHINNKPMEFTKKSKLKVILNVNVDNGINVITESIEYIFNTEIKTYLIQR